MILNQHKKFIALFMVFVIISVLVSSKPYSTGVEDACTQAPYYSSPPINGNIYKYTESNCGGIGAGCHYYLGSQLPGIGVNSLIFPSIDSTYIPGESYNITLQTYKAGVTKFGFELVVIDDSTLTSIGELVVTDTTKCHLISLNPQFSDIARTYITHSTNGTTADSSGYISWNFDWIAPSSDVGPITFYYTTNCTNNDNQSQSDSLYISSFQIKPSTSSQINEVPMDNIFTINYSKSMHTIDIIYALKAVSNVSLIISDSRGRNIKSITYGKKYAGSYSNQINLNENISTGIYNCNFIVNNKTYMKKFYIN
jgi:hypothetical protein